MTKGMINQVVVNKNGAGKVPLFLQETRGQSSRKTLERHLSSVRHIDFCPCSRALMANLQGDCIVSGILNNPCVASLLDSGAATDYARQLATAPSGSYLIVSIQQSNRRILLLAGVDLAGFHFGLADLFQHMVFTVDHGIYGGGDRLEAPAIPYRGFWNWDIRTQWIPDPEMQIRWTCTLGYPWDTDYYLRNVKRMIDGAVDNRISAVTIYGFLRDAHGGVAAAQEICRYAAERGIVMVPGIGTNDYGGFYYEGDHTFNSRTFLSNHPNSRQVIEGKPTWALCPTDPEGIAWLQDGLRWMFETFEIGGVNLENGDFFRCECPRCRAALSKIISPNPDFYQFQYLCYRPALEALRHIPASRWNIYATYSPFSLQNKEMKDPLHAYDRKHMTPVTLDRTLRDKPLMSREYGIDAIAQWNIAEQLRRHIPLSMFLDDGDPGIIYENPLWPKGMSAPAQRNVACQFYGHYPRRVTISAIKELCLRSIETGIEGIYIYGERPGGEVHTGLDYLALSHFAYHPRDSLRDFARAQLAPRVGGIDLANTFIELLAKKEQAPLAERDLKRIRAIARDFQSQMRGCPNAEPLFMYNEPYRYWDWLAQSDMQSLNHGVLI